MKKVIIFILIITILCGSCSLLACGSSDGNSTDNKPPVSVEGETEEEKEEETVVSEFDKLSMHEKLFFLPFTTYVLPRFNDPGSIKIEKITFSAYGQAVYNIWIRGKNAYGGMALTEYFFVAKNWTLPGREPDYEELGTSVRAGICMTGKQIVNERFTAAVKKGLIEPDDEYVDDITYSISQLNKALEELKVEKGYI